MPFSQLSTLNLLWMRKPHGAASGDVAYNGYQIRARASGATYILFHFECLIPGIDISRRPRGAILSR